MAKPVEPNKLSKFTSSTFWAIDVGDTSRTYEKEMQIDTANMSSVVGTYVKGLIAYVNTVVFKVFQETFMIIIHMYIVH